MDAEALFRGLNNTMENLNSTISLQSLSNYISPYNGDPSKFKSWIRQLEKHSLLNNLDDRRKVNTAFLTSTDTVSDYIFRWTTDNPPPTQTWERLKNDLTTRFSLVTDAEHANSLLKKIKQVNVFLFASEKRGPLEFFCLQNSNIV